MRLTHVLDARAARHHVVAEADDEESMATATLTLASQGNLRTTTMRALSTDEMRAVIAKTG